MFDSVWPYRWQPTRLPRPWNLPSQNTGVGCHFLLQCMKVKRESEVTQSYQTLSDPMDCSLPGSSAHGIFQARVLEWGAIAFSGLTANLKTKQNKTSKQSITFICIWDYFMSLFHRTTNYIPLAGKRPRNRVNSDFIIHLSSISFLQYLETTSCAWVHFTNYCLSQKAGANILKLPYFRKIFTPKHLKIQIYKRMPIIKWVTIINSQSRINYITVINHLFWDFK